MENKTMYKLRNYIGLFGILLPVALLVFNCGASESISATHYTRAYLWFEGLMVLVGVFLIFYEGYDIKDKWVTTVAGIGALVTGFFPTSGADYECFIPIPEWLSNVFHCAGALLFFAMMVFMLSFQFTKTSDIKPTPQKLKRSLLYYICSFIIIIGLLVGGALKVFTDIPYTLFFGEAVALWAFGLAWLVKGGVLLKDG